MSPSSHTNEGKTDFVELKNVTLNGWLETAEPPKATQAPIPQLIHHYPGYLWAKDPDQYMVEEWKEHSNAVSNSPFTW